jgi:hypothetical protein
MVQGAWVPDVPSGPDPIGRIDISSARNGVVAIPESADPRLRQWFGRYTCVIAPNGKPIHILAQDGWRDEQVVRARKVLEHILTDAPGSRLGVDKGPIANAMADRRATLVLFDDVHSMERAFDGGLDRVPLGFQDLRANECPVEGDPDYLRHETRDAAFEEVLHLVHDYGIRPVLPDYDEALHRANLGLAARGLWDAWPEDEPENHRNEYFAAAYDNYLDLWAEKPLRYEGEPLEDDGLPEGTSHFGAFSANTRAALRETDPVGFELVEAFFTPYLTYEAELPSDFEGTFSLRREPELRYTCKSQHLVSVRLTGDRDAGITGNGWDNRLIGNAGDNILDGGEGDDVLVGGPGNDRLIGGPGTDVAVLGGEASECRFEMRKDGTYVLRERDGRSEVDVLVDVESVRFEGGRQSVRRIPWWAR